MTDATNVVAFAPRPKEAPPFKYVELRLRSNCTLQLNAGTECGDTVTFEFALCSTVTAADLTRLVAAWDGWRNTSTIAS